MKYLIYLIVGFLALIYGPTAAKRAFDQETKLGLFENRIANIPSELERRSPLYAAVWEEFKNCMQREACDSESILKRRDAIVAREWPHVFDRFTVFKDWGELRESREARDAFFKALEERGDDILRNRCVPKIRFYRLSGRDIRYFEGFECLNQPDVKTSG